MTTLLVIRHGKATPGEATYDQLHPVGEAQARLLGQHLAASGVSFDALYCGPLKRQRDTLSLMRQAAGPAATSWPEAISLEALAEAPIEALVRHAFTDRIAHDVQMQQFLREIGDGSDKARLRAVLEHVFVYVIGLWAKGELTLAGVESARDFGVRVLGAFAEIVRRDGQGRRTVGIVTSNGVIGWLLSHLDRNPDPDHHGPLQRLWNTSVSRVIVESEQLRVLERNLVEHLPGPELHTFI